MKIRRQLSICNNPGGETPPNPGTSEKFFFSRNFKFSSSPRSYRGRIFDFLSKSMIFWYFSTGGGFFDGFGRHCQKIEKSMIFRPKIDFYQNCAQFRKEYSKPFPTPKDSPKIFINGREIAILVHFWGCSRRWVDFGKATFTKNRRKNQGFSYISRRGAHESGSNLHRGRAPTWGTCRNGLGAVGRGHGTLLGRFGADFYDFPPPSRPSPHRNFAPNRPNRVPCPPTNRSKPFL